MLWGFAQTFLVLSPYCYCCCFCFVHSHGIPLSLDGEGLELSINLAQSKSLPEFTPTETWNWKSEQKFDFASPTSNKTPGLFQSPLQRRGIWLDPATTRTFGLQQHRLQAFTEEVASFKAPLKANRKQKAHAMAVFPDNSVHGEHQSTCLISIRLSVLS